MTLERAIEIHQYMTFSNLHPSKTKALNYFYQIDNAHDQFKYAIALSQESPTHSVQNQQEIPLGLQNLKIELTRN
jgi:hypothetical protein